MHEFTASGRSLAKGTPDSPQPRLSVVAVYVEAGVVAVPPIGAAGVERPSPQPVAFVGVIIGTVGEGHAVQQMRMPVPMMVVMAMMTVMMMAVMMMVAVTVPVMVVMVMVTMLHPLREPFNGQRRRCERR